MSMANKARAIMYLFLTFAESKLPRAGLPGNKLAKLNSMKCLRAPTGLTGNDYCLRRPWPWEHPRTSLCPPEVSVAFPRHV